MTNRSKQANLVFLLLIVYCDVFKFGVLLLIAYCDVF